MVKVKIENVDEAKSEKCPTLHKKRTKKAISVLKELNKTFCETKTKKSLLDDSSESSVYLQVTLKKIPPKKMKRMIKVHLPHSLMTETMDICLITGDLEKTNRKAEIEPTVIHYKELLEKCDVKGVTEVVPLRQLRTEYKTFESKRQLSAAYDIFINDKKITGCLPKVLGKAFYEARKFPIQINLNSKNLKDQVEKAVAETVFNLSCRGNSCTSEVARLSMEDEEIMENIQSCIEILAEKLPGKWANVLGLYIKTARSEAIPIYMSFDNPNELKVKAPRHHEKVKAEELSTVRNAEVKVFKDGRLIVKNLPDSEDESKDSEEDSINEKKSKETKELVKNIPDSEDESKDSLKDFIKEKKSKKTKKLAKNILDSEDDSIKKNKNKKPKDLGVKIENEKDREVCVDEAEVKPAIKRRKRVRSVSNNEHEGQVKDSNEADITPRNKRKKGKELISNTSDDITKGESCANLDVLPKIKRKKTKNSNEKDVKTIEIKKQKTNKRNNK